MTNQKTIVYGVLLQLMIFGPLFCCDILDTNRRNDLIKLFLDKYQRPFTMLDIATQASCALAIAHHYPQSVYVVASDNEKLLSDCAQANSQSDNIIVLGKTFMPAELSHLGECEHFDVILAVDSWFELGMQWQPFLKSLLTLGDYVLIKIPAHDPAIKEYVMAQQGQLLGSDLYLMKPFNHTLKRKTWLRLVMDHDQYQILSSFADKQLIKPVSWSKGTLQKSAWVPGINLCTFKMCHGIYPTAAQLKDALHTIKNVKHSDWLINNMILQGSKIALIDSDDEHCKAFFSEELLQAHEEMLTLVDPAKIEHYFWHKLIKVPVARRHTLKLFSQLFPPFALVFDINIDLKNSNDTLFDRYLGYGTKLIYCHSDQNCVDFLSKKYQQENIFFTSKDLLAQRTASSETIDSMIGLYGLPAFCNIHAQPGQVYEILKTASRSIASVAFKFDLHNTIDLKLCFAHLELLGYQRFNFSVREIPGLILENNRYIAQYKAWVNSSEALIAEIDKFAELDHDKSSLWGYIYAIS